MTDKLQINIDSSALRNAHCEMKFWNTVIKGYRSKLLSEDIEFGIAFHLCAKIASETGSIGEGMRKAYQHYSTKQVLKSEKKKFLTPIFLGKVCQEWYESEIRKNDSFEILTDINNENKPLVEQKFKLPFYSGQVCDIFLTGTMDKITRHRRNGLLAVGDYKTTSFWNKQEYLDEYKLSGQLRFYTLALKKFITLCDNNSVLAAYKDKPIGCYIDGVFLKGGANGGEVSFERSDIFQIKQAELNEYEKQLNILSIKLDGMCVKALTPFYEGIFNGTCNVKGRKCSFFDYCSHFGDNVAQEHIINRNFISKYYDPLSFGD